MNECLFNGVKLQALPELPYQYACINESALMPGVYILYICSEPFYYSATEGNVQTVAGANLSASEYNNEASAWGEIENMDSIAGSTGLGGVRWCNEDISDEDGNVYLEGSKPFDLDAFKIGLSLGLCGKAIFSKGEPVPDEPVVPDEPSEEPIGYFYGHEAKEGETATRTIDGVGYVGEVLPKLPDWDTTEFPYAVINLADFNKYGSALLGLHSEPCYFDGTYTMFGSPGICYRYENNTDRAEQMGIPVGEWVYAGMMLGNHYGTRGVDWSNHDIINTTDNSVYLESTDPIPIYE